MASQFINYALPEFCFLDGASHLGDLLEGRTVIQHIRSYSIIEVVCLDEITMSDFKTHQYRFTYTNSLGHKENYLFALHFSLAIDTDEATISEETKVTITDIFEKAANWFKAYMDWEDENILNEGF